MVRGLGATAGTDLRVAVRAQGVVLLGLRLERLRLPPRSSSHLRVLLHVALQRVKVTQVLWLSLSRRTTYCATTHRLERVGISTNGVSRTLSPVSTSGSSDGGCPGSVTSFPRLDRGKSGRIRRKLGARDTSMEVALHLYARSSARYFDLSGYPATCTQAIYHRADLSPRLVYTRGQRYRESHSMKIHFFAANTRQGVKDAHRQRQPRFRSIKLLRRRTGEIPCRFQRIRRRGCFFIELSSVIYDGYSYLIALQHRFAAFVVERLSHRVHRQVFLLGQIEGGVRINVFGIFGYSFQRAHLATG